MKRQTGVYKQPLDDMENAEPTLDKIRDSIYSSMISWHCGKDTGRVRMSNF